ncbi:MAG: hypothetical protein OHK006_01490 [Thermodesulfovibrionales bacterium]
MNGIRVFFLFVLTVVAGALFTAEADATLTAKANHDNIKIDFFYHGSTVSISGVSESGTDLVIKIASPEGHETLKEKGKVGGLLWMNVGSKKFDRVPNFYSIHSTRDLRSILSDDEMTANGIGYAALERRAVIEPVADDEEKARWFDEFIRYKERSRLYTSSSGKIDLKTTEGSQSYYSLIQWPYQAPPGDYLVTVYAVKNGKVVEQAESRVHVEQTGIVKTLASMAKDNAALYGLVSIISALGAGFGVGLVFRKGGGAH